MATSGGEISTDSAWVACRTRTFRSSGSYLLDQPPERHRLDVQMDVYLVDGAAAERQFAHEAVDRRLILAENERGERVRSGRNPGNLAPTRSPIFQPWTPPPSASMRPTSS
jgi:hypothetical protein